MKNVKDTGTRNEYELDNFFLVFCFIVFLALVKKKTLAGHCHLSLLKQDTLACQLTDTGYLSLSVNSCHFSAAASSSLEIWKCHWISWAGNRVWVLSQRAPRARH